MNREQHLAPIFPSGAELHLLPPYSPDFNIGSVRLQQAAMRVDRPAINAHGRFRSPIRVRLRTQTDGTVSVRIQVYSPPPVAFSSDCFIIASMSSGVAFSGSISGSPPGVGSSLWPVPSPGPQPASRSENAQTTRQFNNVFTAVFLTSSRQEMRQDVP